MLVHVVEHNYHEKLKFFYIFIDKDYQVVNIRIEDLINESISDTTLSQKISILWFSIVKLEYNLILLKQLETI